MSAETIAIESCEGAAGLTFTVVVAVAVAPVVSVTVREKESGVCAVTCGVVKLKEDVLTPVSGTVGPEVCVHVKD
jgi:hypothetical protein